ncbi:response regulator [Nitrosopumilus sp.]|uniref:response regulator n=1 Tax=Nitrosopumilus sp. TaxID=2024843 RepID=UPI0026362E2D|nr:response regulator [Nitrosopumilus sp.]
MDDSAAFRAKIKSILKDAKVGFYYYEATNGKEAVSKYIETKPDIVVMDIMMPEVGGIEAMIAVKKHHPQAKIIVASTRDNKDIINEAIKSGGAADYVIKPFVASEVVGAISKQLLLDDKPRKKTSKKITRAFALQAR